MAKLTRKNLKVFAGSSANTGKFGSAQAGTGVLTTDIETIQSLSAWDNGWLSAVLGGNKLPAMEELEGIQRVLSYCIANIYQDGIPVYNSSTTYYTNSIVRQDTTSILYASLTDNNTGNLLTDGTKWQSLGDLANLTANTDPDIVALGNKNTNFTLTANRVHTAAITGSCTLALPTISTSTKYVECMIEFSLASGQSLTLPTVKWDWDYTPTFSTTVNNLILFRTTDNGTTWRAAYKQEGA